MNKAINGVAKGAQEQADAVNRAAELTEQIFAAIQEIAVSAEKQAKGAANSVANSEKNAHIVEDTVKGMDIIHQKVDQSALKVKEMGQRSNEIGTILATIDEIASQTNLLALNAAIEAARAGEHGKGFAVVADEVRKLAEKSASATREISGLIKQIQTSVAEAVNSMDESAQEVVRGTSLATQSRQALTIIMQAGIEGQKFGEEISHSAKHVQTISDDLVGSMERVSAVVEENSAATEEMAAGSTEVTSAVEIIASISEENSAAIEEISASTGEMTSQVEDVATAVQNLSEVTQTLNQVVGRFFVDHDNDLPGFFEMVKQAHLAWVNRFESVRKTGAALNTYGVVDHKNCSLGKWYYSVGKDHCGDTPEYAAVEEPHIQLHSYVAKAVQAYQARDMAAYGQAVEQVNLHTAQMVETLYDLEDCVTHRSHGHH